MLHKQILAEKVGFLKMSACEDRFFGLVSLGAKMFSRQEIHQSKAQMPEIPPIVYFSLFYSFMIG